ADTIISHALPLRPQLEAIGIDTVDFILCCPPPHLYWDEMADTIAPFGRICALSDSSVHLDLNVLKRKSVTFVWEFMFTRSLYETADMSEQHVILEQVALLIDKGQLRHTARTTLSPISVNNVRRAHAMLESGRTVGKIVLRDF
ncbi:MAG: zinc-binding dehydrogenase, partial [Bacilli bacterium]